MDTIGRDFSKKYTLTEKYIDGKSGDSGAMFRVVRGVVKQENSSTEVAIKYSTSAYGNNLMKEEENFFHQLGADTEELAQKHIIAPTDWGILTNNHPAYAMPLLDTSLDRILGESLHISCFSLWAMQLGQALSYLHDKNICHTDLKPGNILLKKVSSSRVDLFLTDFSYAGFQEEIPAKHCPKMGTRYWQAPEQHNMENGLWQIGSWIDMYQLGLIIFHILTEKQLISDQTSTPDISLYGKDEQAAVAEALQKMASSHITPKDTELQKKWVENWKQSLTAMLAPEKADRLTSAELYEIAQESWQSLQGKIIAKLTLPSIFTKSQQETEKDNTQVILAIHDVEKIDSSIGRKDKKIFRKICSVLLICCGIAGGTFVISPLLNTEKESTQFSLHINTTPARSKIIILKPEIRIFKQGMLLPAERYLIDISDPKKEYKSLRKWVPLQKDTFLSLQLEKVTKQKKSPKKEKQTRLTITTVPSNAKIRILKPAKIHFVNGMSLSQDEYTFEIQYKGYETLHDTARLSSDVVQLRYQLDKIKEKAIPHPPKIKKEEKEHFIWLAQQMELTSSPHHIENLLNSRHCATISTENKNANNENVTISFSPQSVLGKQQNILLNIITPYRKLPINNAFIIACQKNNMALECIHFSGNLIPCK